MSSVPSIQRFESDLNSRYSSYAVAGMVDDRPSYGHIEDLSGLPFELADIRASALVAVREPLPPHMQDRVHMLICVEGFVHIQHCQQDSALAPGELLLLDSSESCTIRVPETHLARTIELRRDHLKHCAVPVENIVGTRIAAGTGLSRQVVDLVSSMAGNAAAIRPYAYVLQDIVARMLSCCTPDALEERLHRSSSADLDHMAQWVRERLGNIPVTPDLLAAEFGYSRRNLYRLFARAGLTPNSWLLQIKLDQGRHLLTLAAGRDSLIANIAYSCGFSDAAHFSRLFKKYYGQSPIDFRRQHRPS